MTKITITIEIDGKSAKVFTGNGTMEVVEDTPEPTITVAERELSDLSDEEFKKHIGAYEDTQKDQNK